MPARDVNDQLDAAVDAIHRAVAPEAVLGVYLYGSAVEAGLRPDSDLDLFVVTDRRLRRTERRRLVEALLPISGRDTRPPSWRPLEVTVVARPEVRPWRYPPPWELQYGEWLRDAFLAGEMEPWPPRNPDLAVLIHMVRARSRPLAGPPASDLLDPVPPDDLARAMTDELPALLHDLDNDARNVLLTLARVWATLATGEIRSKDAAANWALERLSERHRGVLRTARDLYLHGGHGAWDDTDAVRGSADALLREISEVRERTGRSF